MEVASIRKDSVYDAAGQIIDHVGGLDDIANRVIRTVGELARRFSEDALRMMRAVRFACELGLRPLRMLRPLTLTPFPLVRTPTEPCRAQVRWPGADIRTLGVDF